MGIEYQCDRCRNINYVKDGSLVITRSQMVVLFSAPTGRVGVLSVVSYPKWRTYPTKNYILLESTQPQERERLWEQRKVGNRASGEMSNERLSLPESLSGCASLCCAHGCNTLSFPEAFACSGSRVFTTIVDRDSTVWEGAVSAPLGSAPARYSGVPRRQASFWPSVVPSTMSPIWIWFNSRWVRMAVQQVQQRSGADGIVSKVAGRCPKNQDSHALRDTGVVVGGLTA